MMHISLGSYLMLQTLFASGSRDGSIMLWDKRVSHKDGHMPAVNAIRGAHSKSCVKTHLSNRKTSPSIDSNKVSERLQSVTSVVFQDDSTLMSAGSIDGSVKVWDLRKFYITQKSTAMPKHLFPYAGTCVRSHGFSNLTFDSSRTRLFASCIDNLIYQFDCAAFTTAPVAVFNGHVNSTFYVKAVLSPDSAFLLSGSSDGNAYVWMVDRPGAGPRVLRGHVSEVTGVEWCRSDVGRLVTLSDDNVVSIWRINQQHRETSSVQDGTVVIGRTARCTDLSVSSSGSHSTASSLRSPCKGSVLPKSAFMTLSPAVRQGLGALPSSLPHSTSSSLGSRRQLSSPQITKWFRKSTPRKLNVTPKKSASLSHDAKSPHIAGVKRKLCSEPDMDQDNSLGVAQLELKIRRPSRENDHKLSLSKPQRTEPATTASVLSPVQSNRSNRTLGKTSTDVSSPTQFFISSGGGDVASFCSPTINLPNYVYDPKPRTPIGPRSSPVKRRKSPDWLTQLRLQRQGRESANGSARSPTGRGQTNRSVAKILKSFPCISRSDSSMVTASISKESSSKTENNEV